MSKIQKVKFSTIEEFLEHLPRHELEIVQRLRNIILSCFLNPLEKISYNVPFYFQNSRICFIWPASVPWGKVKMNGVQLGFSKGYLMRDEIGYLEKGNRKQVYTKTFMSLDEIEPDIIKTYVLEAIRVDEES